MQKYFPLEMSWKLRRIRSNVASRVPLRRNWRISWPRGWTQPTTGRIIPGTEGLKEEGMSTRALGHRPTFDLTTRSAPVCTSTTGPFLPASRNPPLFLRPPRLPPYSQTDGIGSVEQKITFLLPLLISYFQWKFFIFAKIQNTLHALRV